MTLPFERQAAGAIIAPPDPSLPPSVKPWAGDDVYIVDNAGDQMLESISGSGNDAMVGKGAADAFAFTTAFGSTNVDHIADMVSGTDKIALDDAVFGGLAPGALNANAFVIGNAAGDADDRIGYNSATGQLFDPDGNGSGAAVLFAVLDGHPAARRQRLHRDLSQKNEPDER